MEYEELKRLQNLSLEDKIVLTKKYVTKYYEHTNEKIYVSFSGGKDSTVLLRIVRELYPETIGVFSDTGLEYPEIKMFVKTFDNIVTVKPKMKFNDVVEKYGYPVVSKKVARAIEDLKNPTDKNVNIRNLHLTGYTRNGTYAPSYKLSKKWRYLIDSDFKISAKCCDKLKKEPLNTFEKNSGLNRIIGTMATESSYRTMSALKNEINNYGKKNICSPFTFWTEQDILNYILKYNIEFCSVYGEIKENSNGELYTTQESRTGCMFCMFGAHLEPTPNRFQRMKVSHPNQYKYCIETLGCGKILDYINVEYE